MYAILRKSKTNELKESFEHLNHTKHKTTYKKKIDKAPKN